MRLDPGEHGRGMSFSLSPVIGASSSATERLWGVRDAHALGAPAGIALVGGRFAGTPNAGFGLSDDGKYDFRIGWRLTSAVPGDPGFSGEPRRPARGPGAAALTVRCSPRDVHRVRRRGRHDLARAGGDCVRVDPDEPGTHGRIVAVRADGPGSATPMRLMAVVESDRSVRPSGAPRPARHGGDPRQRDHDPRRGGVRRAGGLRRNAPSLPFRRPDAAGGAFRGMSPGGGNPVVTGRQIGLQASGGKGCANEIVGARVMTRC